MTPGLAPAVAGWPSIPTRIGTKAATGEQVLGADGAHLAELHERLELARLVAVRLQAGEEPDRR
jgi:hypothetical protein